VLVKNYRKGVENYNSGENSQVVFFFDKGVLNKMEFSSVVLYLGGGIDCAEGMCPFF